MLRSHSVLPTDFAEDPEKEAENFYRGLAEQSPDSGLRSILTKLADVEVKHFETLQKMKDQRESDVALDGDNYRRAFQALFRDLGQQAAGFDFDAKQVEVYKLAQEREEEAREFYMDQAKQAKSDVAAGIFETLAVQEKLHYDILDSIVQFVSRPEPGNWLENAEWYHSEDY